MAGAAAALLGMQTLSAAPARKPAASKPAPAKTGPAAHAQFPAFLQALDKMVQENSTDYYEAVAVALQANGEDETALNSWMQAAAQGGNAAALRWELSRQLSSIPTEKLLSPEIKKAYQQLLSLAGKGYVPAMLDVSACLRVGIGVVKNEAASQKQLIEACKGGDMKSRFTWLMSTGRLTAWEDKDKPEVDAEVKRGNHYVIYHLSGLAPTAALQVEWMKDAAGKGSGEAYLALSSLAAANHPKESLMLLRLAVHLHHPEALFVLASALADAGAPTPFQQQAGITPDNAEALRLMKTAAALGCLRAALALGGAYFEGLHSLPKDHAKALFHYSNPFVADRPQAMAARGLLLLIGEGISQDRAQGISLLEKAAKVYPGAAINLAWAHFKGIGVQEDGKAASDILKETAAAGVPEAYVYLAYLCAKGARHFPADLPQAKSYVRLAALDLGDAAQQLYDALMLHDWSAKPF